MPSSARAGRRALILMIAAVMLAAIIGVGFAVVAGERSVAPSGQTAPEDQATPATPEDQATPATPEDQATQATPEEQATPEDQATPVPVLLVPGYGGSRVALGRLAETLRRQGRTVVVIRLAGDGKGNLNQQADVLDVAVRRQLRRQHASGVDVVGYSAGGVIARLWVRDHGGDDLARRIITLGSPHHGTFLAGYRNRAVECPKACKQLAPRSGLLARLGGGDETPTGPDWVSIWSDDDEVVTPPSSARLHGAVNISVQDICGKVVVAHRDLPRNREVMGLVSYELSAAVPTVPRVTACSVVR